MHLPNEQETGILRVADVLIVDDNPTNLDLLADLLGKHGFHVRLANSGRRALAAVQNAVPDLVMLDINMPQLDGYEVCRQLKEAEHSRAVPVIFLSARDEVLDKVKAFAVGGADYVTKPFEFAEVLARIENQLQIARLQRETARQNAELARRNEELSRKNAELLAARDREATIFEALSEALPGTVLDGRYRLEEKIGTGGFGAVFRARQIALDREVAVKVLHPPKHQSGELKRFLKEGVSACRVNHPNAVAIIDCGLGSGMAYLVMELLQGRSLAEELVEWRPLTPERTVEIALPVCRVLAEAHAAGVVHRDIKPENIFLHRIRDETVVKVVDFGVAKLVEGDGDHGPSNPSTLVGTPHYMAPERVRIAPYDGRADIYGLGVTLYYMLAGVLPFEGMSLGSWLVAAVGKGAAVPPLRQRSPEVPAALEEAVRRAMARDPAERPSAAELEGLLARSLEPSPETASA